MSSNKETKTRICVFSPSEILDKNKKEKRRNNVIKRFAESEYGKSVSRMWKESRKRIACGAVAAVTALTVCATVSSLGWSFGYEVYIDGENIGFVTEKSGVFEAIDDTRHELKLHFGDKTVYEKEPVFVRRIVSDDELVSKELIKDSLLSNVDKLVKGYVLYIDGKKVFGTSEQDNIEKVLARYKSQKVDKITDDMAVEFCEKVEIKNEYISKSALKNTESAFAILASDEKSKPRLSVKTVQTVELTEEVPYKVEKIDDNSAYEGDTVVAREGKNGEKTVLATITRVNGVETDKKVISTVTLTEPVSRIEKIGTKEKPATTGSGSFVNPSGGILSSRYGQRWDRSHNGIDIAGTHNSAIKAADGGIVTYAGWMDGYGNYVVIDHENGYQTAYGHCASLNVNVGDRVAKGHIIAKMGNTGRSTGTHLHFEVKKDGVFVNPLEYVGY